MSYDILSKNFEMLLYDGIQYLDQGNVSQLTQNIHSHARAIDLIWPKLSNLIIQSLRIFLKSCGIMGHNT